MVILPASSDQISQPSVRRLRYHRSHLLSKFLLDRPNVHIGKRYLPCFQLVEDHAEWVNVDWRLVMEAFLRVWGKKHFACCPRAQVLVLGEQFSELFERFEVVVGHVYVQVWRVQHDVFRAEVSVGGRLVHFVKLTHGPCNVPKKQHKCQHKGLNECEESEQVWES